MKAISLWQPWASLVADGAKLIETRHWPAPARLAGERIAIHAAKTRAHLFLVGDEPFRSALGPWPREIPLGVIVATAELIACELITADLRAEVRSELGAAELVFGDFTDGRYAWHLGRVRPLAEPIPTVGRQGFFDVPDPRTEARRPADPAPEKETDKSPASAPSSPSRSSSPL